MEPVCKYSLLNQPSQERGWLHCQTEIASVLPLVTEAAPGELCSASSCLEEVFHSSLLCLAWGGSP